MTPAKAQRVVAQSHLHRKDKYGDIVVTDDISPKANRLRVGRMRVSDPKQGTTKGKVRVEPIPS